MKIQNIKKIVAELSLKEQILELLMLDVRYFTSDDGEVYPVRVLPQEIDELLADYPLGGIILFRENLANLDEIIELNDKLQKNAKFGRLIAIDQEGGTVTRIHHATEMPGNMALGAIDDTLVTAQASQVLATELDALGFNFMFSPVFDVNSNPQNPIVGVRSFGKYPQLVARHGVAYCDGLNRIGLIGCGKHFPGHGDTDSDSHHALPIINKSIEDFTAIDLLPFEVAIDANIDSIMTAHIVFPNLDNGIITSNKTGKNMPIPATLSKVILTDLLRDKMNYAGVVVSDALDMKAISDNFTATEATLRCIEAGVDLVLMPIRLWSKDDIENFKTYIAELVVTCQHSESLQQRVFESCCRVLALKQRKVLPKLMAQVDLAERKKIMQQTVLSQKFQSLQQEIAYQAITLAKNTQKILPWKTSVADKILVISANEAVAHDARNALTPLGFNDFEIICVDQALDAKNIRNFTKALVLTYNLNTESAKSFNGVIKLLNDVNIPYVVISCHSPYDNLYLENVATNVLAFGCSGLDQTNYSIRKFELNMSQAIKKVMLAQNIEEYNLHAPI